MSVINNQSIARGRIKLGQGTLIGNAGEYYVVAELLKRGIIATLTPRNTPAFDVFATKGDQMVRIRVKTKSEQYIDWQWMAKKDGAIFRNLEATRDFTVLVNLTMDSAEMAYFVVPTLTIDSWLRLDFEEWVNTPGKRGQPHNASNTKRNLSFTRYANRLEPYLHAWNLLWTD